MHPYNYNIKNQSHNTNYLNNNYLNKPDITKKNVSLGTSSPQFHIEKRFSEETQKHESLKSIQQLAQKALFVGGGPTALFSALNLQSQGYSVKILEKRAKPDRLSHAFALSKATLDALIMQGITKQDLGASFTQYSDGSGSIIIEHLEEILEKKFLERGGILSRNTELALLDNSEGLGYLKDRTTEKVSTFNLNNYAWIFGSDGANSTVSQLLNISSDPQQPKDYALRFVVNQAAEVRDLHPQSPIIENRLVRQYVNGGQTYYNAIISKDVFETCKKSKEYMKKIAHDILKEYGNAFADIMEIDVMELNLGHRKETLRSFAGIKPRYLLLGDAVAQSHFVKETGFNTHVLATGLFKNMMDLVLKNTLSLEEALAIYQEDARSLYQKMRQRSL